jgi:CheY-like chemotaxis protein
VIGTLIVDDQTDVRLLLRMIIERSGDLFVTGEAASGAEAIEHVEAENPAVIVLDMMMPGMNGVETATAIRADRPNQPIILCTAYLDADVIERAHAAGIVECISKNQLWSLPQLIRDVAGAA